MPVLGPRCPVQLFGGALLAILASFFAPATARAECGDYVHFGTPAAKSVPPTAPAVNDTTAEKPVPEKRPCTGPSCSERRLPPPVPIVSVNPTVEHWGFPIPTPPLPTRDARSSFVETCRVEPSHFAPSVYHPPRLGTPFAPS